MSNTISDLLLIQSLNLADLIESYRSFFMTLLPGVFMLALIVEYFDRLDPFALMKRAVISIVILSSAVHIYAPSISASMQAADEMLSSQKHGNILLNDMFKSIDQWDQLNRDRKAKQFYKDKNALWGTLDFLKYHLFDAFINNGFTVSIYFITQLCFLILKVVYSLIYYLGIGLLGISCLIYLFPSMGNVLRGAILSYLWCLVLPHVLVFLLTLIGQEVNKGYISGQVIGGSLLGSAFLFILCLFVAFTPLIVMMILNGSGMAQAGGIIGTLGANYVMNLPKNTVNNSANALATGSLGPKMQLFSQFVSQLGKNSSKNDYKFNSNQKGQFDKKQNQSAKSHTQSKSQNRSYRDSQAHTQSQQQSTYSDQSSVKKDGKRPSSKTAYGFNRFGGEGFSTSQGLKAFTPNRTKDQNKMPYSKQSHANYSNVYKQESSQSLRAELKNNLSSPLKAKPVPHALTTKTSKENKYGPIQKLRPGTAGHQKAPTSYHLHKSTHTPRATKHQPYVKPKRRS